MRYTVVDGAGTTSFVGPDHLMKMLAAACSRDPADLAALLLLTEEFDPKLTRAIAAGLDRFDAVRVRASPLQPAAPTPNESGEDTAGSGEDTALPFRVVDESSRRQSLAPASAGLVVFNLPAKRIVQIQNSYAELRRQDRGRLRRDGRPVRAYYSYELPPEWIIVP